MSEIKKNNIIIVDDHKMFLDGLISIIKNNPTNHEIVFHANDGKAVIKHLEINKDLKVDLIITDINMPEIDGIALNKYIKKNFSHIKTLIVSMLNDSDNIHTLTKDDVDGYVPKNAEKEELLLAIETILNGEKYFSENIKKTYMESIFNQKKDQTVPLTKREKEVLTLIAKEHTTQEIADTLFLSKHTIEGYRKNLISKLAVRNLAGLTKHAIKLGLLD